MRKLRRTASDQLDGQKVDVGQGESSTGKMALRELLETRRRLETVSSGEKLPMTTTVHVHPAYSILWFAQTTALHGIAALHGRGCSKYSVPGS